MQKIILALTILSALALAGCGTPGRGAGKRGGRGRL